MKIIIDANVASAFSKESHEAKCILAWINTRGKLSTGGKNLEELAKTRIMTLILELLRAGRGERVATEQIAAAESGLPAGVLVSDDPHVIALAIAGGARVLFTEDQALMDDFGNPALLARPRGRVYRDATRHGHLLT